MKMIFLLKLSISLYIVFPHFVMSQVGDPNVTSHESRLIQDILAVHDIRRRPAKNTSAPMVLTVDFYLGRIHEFNEKAGMLTTFGWLAMSWKDEFIFWNPNNYGGIARVILPAEDVWKPEVVIENSVSDLEDIGTTGNSRLMILADGTVIWVAGRKVQTTCNPDVTRFPYDVSTCSISLSNWIYTGSLLQYQIGPHGVGLLLYKNNSNWSLDSTNAHIEQRGIVGAPETYTIAHFVLVLKRKPQYFILNLIIPVLLVSALALVSFWVPTEAGEKLAVVMSSFVTVAVLMLYVSGLLPQESDHVSYIEVWMLLVTVLTTLSLILNTISVRMHYYPESSRPPIWLKRMCCFRRRRVEAENTVTDLKCSKQLENVESEEGPARDGITWTDCARRFDKIMFFFMFGMLLCSTIIFLSQLSA